jgi:hypothetical protein
MKKLTAASLGKTLISLSLVASATLKSFPYLRRSSPRWIVVLSAKVAIKRMAWGFKTGQSGKRVGNIDFSVG